MGHTKYHHRVLAINAVSFVIAIIANLALIAKNFGRIPFKHASLITIIGWYVASFLLIGLVAAAPSHLPLPLGKARMFTQAYYYACLAAAVYFVVASLLVCTASGVYMGRYTSDIKLTFSQSTLMVQVILFLGYVLAAAAVYAKIEDWDYLDGVYYITVTLFTIGFGDFTPKSHLGRGLLFPMAVGGILFVGLIIASISTLVLDRGSTKVSIRMVEKARQRLVNSQDQQLNDNAPITNISRREQEFNLMRRVQSTAATYNRTIAVAVSLSALIVLWFIGAVCFWQAEVSAQDWSYFQALYFTYVSLLTIGYGDFYPQDNSAKPIFVLWTLVALPTLTVLIGSLGGIINEAVNSITLWLGSHHLPGAHKSATLSALNSEAAKAKGEVATAAKPPGFLEDGIPDDHGTKDSLHAEAVRRVINGSADDHCQDANDGPKATAIGEKDEFDQSRRYLIMKELRNIIGHLDANPPRKYTFQEWAWFTKLLGEDEGDPPVEDHEINEREPEAGFKRKEGSALDVRKGNDRKNDRLQGINSKNGLRHPWSWLGSRSPLIMATDEPQWVLERLMGALEEELKG